MSDVMIQNLDEVWSESEGDPLTIFEQDDPALVTGSYVMQPDERVPESGTTSHHGTEVSVILEGEVELGLPESDETRVAGPYTVTVIPSGTEHYSRNSSKKPVRLVYAVFGKL